MKKIIPIVFTLLASAVLAHAQVDLPDKVKVSLPRELKTGLINNKLAHAIQQNPPVLFDDETGYWRAYSDRADNPTYNSPSISAEKYATLDFGQEVIIADITDGWALIYSDVQDADFPYIPQSATPLGWIPVDNLLLWHNCPVTNCNIHKKALITANIDHLDKVKLNFAYSAPTGGDSTVITMQKIYFVMKELDGRTLLASEYTLDSDSSSQVLVGWVSSDSYTPWNHCLCLEPSSNRRDILEDLDGKRAIIYADPELTQIIASWMFDKDNISRMDSSWLRFPVMEESTKDSTYKCVIFGEGGSVPQNDQTTEWLIEKLGKETAQKILNNESLIAYSGYTPKATALGTPYWNPVLFISQEELNYILSVMRPAYEVALNGGDDRKPYVEALEALTKFVDPSSTQTCDNDIIKLIFAVNIDPSVNYGRPYTLNDLMEPKVVTPETYRGILQEFKCHYEHLVEISKKYEYTRKFQGLKYYWIPVVYLP